MKIFRFLGKGIGHEDKGEECQDRLSVITTVDERTVLTISDGCSSSAFARETAQRNIDVINKIFSRFSIKELSRDSFAEMYPMLEEHLHRYEKNDVVSCFSLVFSYELAMLAKELEVINPHPADFSATLLFVICETNRTMIGHIGDGNIVFFDKKGNVVYQSAADNGKDSTHTYFTIDDEFTKHFRLNVIPTKSYSSLILFSDGPQTMFKLERGTVEEGAYRLVVEPIFKELITTNKELASVLQKSLANAMHYGFDDWSVIVAVKRSKTLSETEPVSLKQMFMEVYDKGVSDTICDNDVTDSDIREEVADKAGDPLQIPDIKHNQILPETDDRTLQMHIKKCHHKRLAFMKNKRCPYD